MWYSGLDRGHRGGILTNKEKDKARREAQAAYKAVEMPALEAYMAVERPARAAYQAVESSARAAYDAIERPAQAACQARLREIEES